MKEDGEVHDNLIDILDVLGECLGKITTEIKHADEPCAKNFSEQAIETENNGVPDTLSNAGSDEKIDALQMTGGTGTGAYGRCVICGEVMQNNRIKALPFSNKCVKCAQIQI